MTVIIFASSFVVTGVAFGMLVKSAFREYKKEVEEKFKRHDNRFGRRHID
jgi:hypothetical protein